MWQTKKNYFQQNYFLAKYVYDFPGRCSDYCANVLIQHLESCIPAINGLRAFKKARLKSKLNWFLPYYRTKKEVIFCFLSGPYSFQFNWFWDNLYFISRLTQKKVKDLLYYKLLILLIKSFLFVCFFLCFRSLDLNLN